LKITTFKFGFFNYSYGHGLKFAKKLPEAMDHHFAPDIPIGSSARGRRSRAVHAVPKLAAMAVSETKWIHESSLKNGDTVGCPFPWHFWGKR
jgi:hypothetical protein